MGDERGGLFGGSGFNWIWIVVIIIVVILIFPGIFGGTGSGCYKD